MRRCSPAIFELRSSLVVGNHLQLLQPRSGFAGARRAIVAARRQGTAGADLGGVRNATPFELAVLKEAQKERSKMGLDLTNAISATLFHRDIRPRTHRCIMPGTICEEGN